MINETSNRKKLIILDDEEMMILSLKRSFRATSREFDVKGFTSARTALNELDKGDCFAFITDIMMPDMTGDKVVEYIREKHPTQPCIVITGYAARDKISRIAKCGNTVKVLLKPLEFERLLETLNHLAAG